MGTPSNRSRVICKTLSSSAPSQIPDDTHHSPRPAVRKAALRLVVVIVALAALLAVLGLTVVGRHDGYAIQGWDETVGRWFLHHRVHLVGTSKVMALIGDAPYLGVLTVTITVLLFLGGLRIRAIIPPTAFLGGEFLVYLTRLFVHRPRPLTSNYPAPGAIPGIHEMGASFPSGHATAGSAVLVSLAGLAVLTWRAWWPWIIGVALALALATSRLVLGVHWFSDVTFGFLVGAAWGVTVIVVLADIPWPFRWPRDSPSRVNIL